VPELIVRAESVASVEGAALGTTSPVLKMVVPFVKPLKVICAN
jgi:hypothetical protein